MGTRSTYRFIKEVGGVKTPISLVYFQFDGYPDGHPLETAKWVNDGILVNGFSTRDGIIFNGLHCMIAQFIAKYKDGVGNVYIYQTKDRNKLGENYLYDIIVNEETKTITINCYESGERPKLLFSGSPSEYITKFDK